ncbi:hypothetical protein SAMN02799631_00367 [Methylobacterium sp. 174MFSha1.1]|uniref:hypothetical protein n=1 Tax=Methylobacterium sp. 174MFSha1.1 TaxID=1502749 RepID=UPI0008F37482|nr:hypothetical protein [Methylobacterium sp. 174MFSha1.1]SFU38517.1 hypothetical protein SAMN02799631_00367 [Methylobacterium sp. 174MFSha1.1]
MKQQQTRGEISVYAGRTLLGTIRRSAGSVYAFMVDGTPVGAFGDQKAATAALAAQTAGTTEDSR